MKKLLTMSFLVALTLGMTACFSKKEPPQKKPEVNVDKIVDHMIENSEDDLSDEDKEQIKEIFDSQDVKEQMQKTLEEQLEDMDDIMKVTTIYQDCLEDADSKKDAVRCYEKADKVADKLGLNDDEDDDDEFNADEEFGDRTPGDKKRVLDELKQSMEFFEQMKNGNFFGEE